jgi:hypothetical protein
MLTTGLTEIDSIYKNGSTISSKHKILAEWNHNSYYKIDYVGSYPVYIDAKSTGSNDYEYSKTFVATDAGGWDNGGLYNTVSVDDEVIPKENKERKDLCSLYNVVEVDRPDPGIIYGIGSQYSSTIIEDSATVKSYNILQSPVRLYPLSNNQGFKYWNSFRYCKPNSVVANEDTPAITHELIGKSGADLRMKGNNAFIVYENGEFLKTNKIVVKTQTVNGYAKDFTVQVLKAGSSTWSTIYFENDQTRLDSAKIKTITTGTSGSENITLSDNSGIYVGMRVVQPGSTANIPVNTYVEFVGLDGLVVLSKKLTGNLQNVSGIKFIDTPSLSDGIFRITGKKVNGVVQWSLAGAVEQENAVTEFKIPTDGVSGIDVEVITGIRFSAQEMSKQDATLDIIEISPRLVVDFTSYTESLSVDTTIGDSVLGLPVGSIVSSTGSIDLFNENNLISNKNTNSILDNLLKPNVKFTILNVITSGQIQKFVPVKVLYAESWDEESNWRVSVSLEDSMRFLKDKPAPDMLLAARNGIKVSAIIKILLDNAGYNRFSFVKSKEELAYEYEDIPLDFFRCRKEESVAEVLNEVAKSAQLSIFFDSFNNLVAMTKEAVANKTDLYDYWLVGDINELDSGDSEYLFLNDRYTSNIENFEDTIVPPITAGEIAYDHLGMEKKPLNLVKESLKKDGNVDVLNTIKENGYSEVNLNRNLSYVPHIVWQPSNTDLDAWLGVGALQKNLNSSDGLSYFNTSGYEAQTEQDAIREAYYSLSNSQRNDITIFIQEEHLTSSFQRKYNGYVTIDDEMIKYNGVLYKVSRRGFSTDLIIYFSEEEKLTAILKAPSGSSFIPVGLIVDLQMKIISSPDLENSSYKYVVTKTGRGFNETDVASHITANDPSAITWSPFSTKLYSSDQPGSNVKATINLLTQTKVSTGDAGVNEYLYGNAGYAKLVGPPSYTTSSSLENLPPSDQILIRDQGQQFLTGFKKAIGFNPHRIGAKIRILESSSNSTFAGIGLYNSSTNTGTNGYFLEVSTSGDAFEADKPDSNNIRFYKVSGSDRKPQLLGVGFARVNPAKFGEEGTLPAYAALGGDDGWRTTFSLDVVTYESRSYRAFDVYFEDILVFTAIDDTKVGESGYIPPRQNVSMFVRDDSAAIFEYFYATAIPNGINVSVTDPVLSAPEPFSFDQAIDRGIFSSSARQILGTNYKIFYEDFGCLVREVRKIEARFPFPTFAATLIELGRVVPDYIVKNFKYTSFGGEFWIYCTAGATVRIDSESSIPVYVSGILLDKLGGGTVQIDDYINSLDIEERKNQELEINRKLYGEQSYNISGSYISGVDMARKLANWVAKKASKEKTVISAEIFPNPLLQLGDKIKVFYKARGYCVDQDGDKTYVLSRISYSATPDDISMNVELREML